MKKNLTKKLMLSVLTLAFAVVSLGASTFAWFTLSKDAEVKQFSGQVTAGAGLELQVLHTGDQPDPLKWQTATITSQQVADIIGDVTLTAVTPGFTAGGLTAIDWNETNDRLLKFTGLDSSTEKTSGWIQFDLAFRLSDTTENPIDLYLSDYSLTSEDKLWRANTNYYNGKGELIKLNDNPGYRVADAARLGIIVTNDGALTTTPAQAFYETKAGSTVNTKGQPYEPKTAGEGESAYSYTTNAAVNYYNKVHENEPLSQLNVANAPQYNVGTEFEDTKGQLIGQLADGEVVIITVAVWVEGWDGECLNAIFSQTLNATLSFYLDVAEIQ